VWRIVREATPYFEALNIFYRREAFEETGGFDEEIGWWGEDTAAGWRVLEAGWTRDFASDALAVHPVEPRGWNWYLRSGLLERNNISLAARFPGFRDEAQWRTWAVRPEPPAFLLALVGLLLSRRFRPALLLLAPYVVLRRPSVRRASFFRLCLQIPLVDAAQTIGHLRGSLENGIVVV
jgi:GT2 family glycosyltransferase